MPLINGITDILGPFLVSDLAADETTEDWEGTYTESYQVPEHLKVDVFGNSLGKSIPKTATSAETLGPRSLQNVLGHEVASTSTKRKDALTQVLAYSHSRGRYKIII
jgi:hypothetical protein